MNRNEFERLAGLMAKLAYELHDLEGLSKEASEIMLDIWREFTCYEENSDD